MSLLPSEEQRELEHSLRDFLSREVNPEYLRKRIASDQPSDPNLWKGLQELGLLSYFASQDTDVRPGVRELGIVARESGRALLPERIVDNIFAGPFLYFQFLPPNMRALIAKTFGSSLPDAIESGGKSVGLAAVSFAKPIIVGLRNTGPLYRVSAKLPLVAYATLNNYLLFCGRPAEAAPVSLYLADLGTGKEQLVKCDATGALDLSRPYHDVQLENVAALDLGVEMASGLRNIFSAIVAEELGGMCARVVDLTLEYVKTRKQFGVAIGSFQAVQHKLSDMHLQSEALRSLAAFATWAAQESKEQSELSSRAALAFACEHAPQIIETAIQMHGGIGFTWEYELHLYLRRAKMLELLLGSGEAEHQSLIAAVK